MKYVPLSLYRGAHSQRIRLGNEWISILTELDQCDGGMNDILRLNGPSHIHTA